MICSALTTTRNRMIFDSFNKNRSKPFSAGVLSFSRTKSTEHRAFVGRGGGVY
ncbi:MAG: hypothetical protein M1169_00345 [Firmicutes bacterium]|nr:hypothetical protein [Bacillota bacterium]